MKEKNKRLIALSVGILSICAMFFAVNFIKNRTENVAEIVLEDEIVNSNIDTASRKVSNLTKEERDKLSLELQEEIKDYLGDEISSVGISYYNLATGEYFGFNDDEYFTAASTVKVPIAMVVADKLNNGQVSEGDLLYYNYADYEEGAGVLQTMDLSVGYDIMTLMKYMICDSDNIATNMILRNYGYRAVKDSFADYLGYQLSTYDNVITSQEVCIYLQDLYYNKNNNPYYDYVIELMKNTIYHDRLDKYLDQSIVAHKIGDFVTVANDIGIVYTDEPYIIAIYTDGIYDSYEKIATISKMINEYNTSF